MTITQPSYNKAFLETEKKELKKNSGISGEHYRVLEAGKNPYKNSIRMDNVSCFGRFHYLQSEGYAPHPDFRPEVMIVYHPNVQKTESIKAFTDWCLNASPYADVFMDKDVDYVNGNNAFALNCHLHARMVIGAAICIRYRTQMTNIINQWYKLVTAGVQPDLAFVLSHYFQNYSKTGFVSAIDPGAHGLWEARFSTVQATQNFLGHNHEGAPVEPRSVHSGYYAYSGLWAAWTLKGEKGKQLKMPKFNHEARIRAGWGSAQKLQQMYAWDKIDSFLEEFLETNELLGSYAAAIKRSKREARRAA